MPETLDLLDEDLLHLGVPRLDLELEHLMSLARLGCLPTEVEDYARCTDEQLASILGIITEHDRMVAGHKALVAGLIAQRSRPELGLGGLAQSKGHRSAEEFLRATTGSSAPEAKRTVALGRVVVEAAAQPDQASGVIPDAVAAWLHDPARALQAGRLSPEQFRSIEGGLGRPQQDVTVAMLAGPRRDSWRRHASWMPTPFARSPPNCATSSTRRASRIARRRWSRTGPSASRGCPTG